jgi:hypothetical protein
VSRVTAPDREKVKTCSAGGIGWLWPCDTKPGEVHIPLEGEMKVLTGLALLIGLAACNTRSGDQETGRVTADTTVTPVQTQDTTIVKKETKVNTDVDTVHKKGDMSRDSVRR